MSPLCRRPVRVKRGVFRQVSGLPAPSKGPHISKKLVPKGLPVRVSSATPSERKEAPLMVTGAFGGPPSMADAWRNGPTRLERASAKVPGVMPMSSEKKMSRAPVATSTTKVSMP